MARPRLAALLEEHSHISIPAACWFHQCLVSGLLSRLLEQHISACHIGTHVKSQRAGDWLPAAHPVPSHLAPSDTQGTEMPPCGGFSDPLLLNIFIELNEFPPGSIHSTAFAASALFMERGGNIKYKREIMHKPAEIS